MESTPRAYRLKAGNAASPISTFSGAIPVIEAVAAIGHKELKKSGAFVVPGLAKFIVVKKPATKARQGINPFTKEPTTFKAKPARKIVRARPVKAVKEYSSERHHLV